MIDFLDFYRQISCTLNRVYIYALPDGARAELIDGKIYMMTPSSQSMDYLTKIFKYQTAGVREY